MQDNKEEEKDIACVAGVRKGRGRELGSEITREGGGRRRRGVPFLSPSRRPNSPFPFPFKRRPRRLRRIGSHSLPLPQPAQQASKRVGDREEGKKEGDWGERVSSSPLPLPFLLLPRRLPPPLMVKFSFSYSLAIATISTHRPCYERHMLISEEVGILNRSRFNRLLF